MCASGADNVAFLPCPCSLPFPPQTTSGKAVFLTKPLNKSIAKQLIDWIQSYVFKNI